MKVGDKVKCIDGIFHPETIKLIPNRPYNGYVDYVRDVIKRLNGENGILLEGLHNPLVPVGEGENGYTFEGNFKQSRFIVVEDYELTDTIYEDDFMYA